MPTSKAKKRAAIVLSKRRRAGEEIPPPPKGRYSEATRQRAVHDVEVGREKRRRRTTKARPTARKGKRR